MQKDIAQVAQSHGLEGMGELAARDVVDWQAVQEIHDKWSKSDGGLGAGGMLIVAIITSAVTAGAASSLALSTMGLQVAANGTIVTAAGAAASATELAMHAALSAAFTSISAQVATSVADAAAGGDLGSNLGNIFSESGLRSLAATMVMAGTLSTYGSDFAKMGPEGEIFAKTTVKTLTSTLIEGEGLEGAFRTALGSTFASYAKGAISPEDLNEMVNLILTGATGAAGLALAGGDPVQGALSAMLAELAENIKAPELSDQQKAEARSKAELSKLVYEEDGELPEGYERVDLDAKGINPSIMVDEDSGFHSELFYNKETKEYVVAYRGTEIGQSNDLKASLDQRSGDIGDQYKKVKDQIYAIRKIVDLEEGANLTATGHSLGGGLTLAAAATGLVDNAIAFNPAGVHVNTIDYMSEGNSSLVEAIDTVNQVSTSYISRGDILNNIQDLFSFMTPVTMGPRLVVEGGGAHFIEDMIDALQ